MKYLKDLNLGGKHILVRADLNISTNNSLQPGDEVRLKQLAPTLKAIVEAGGKPIIMGHCAPPSGKVNPENSLRPCVKRLAELTKIDVQFAPDCVGPIVTEMVKNLEPGRAILLENLRFHPGEESNDPQFAQALATLGQVYVNDAFSASHLRHASIVGLPAYCKEKCAGLLVQAEMAAYEKTLLKPKKPLCVVMGGAKVSTKFLILNNIAALADKLIIGGAMANTFLAAQGIQMGRSLYEKELIPKVLELFAVLARRGVQLYLPVDAMVGPSSAAKGLGRAVPVQELPADMMALDIGPATSLLFREAIQNAETVIWSGPMGAFENEEYAKGTTDMIETLASAHAVTLVGGGETNSAIQQMQLGHKFSHLSVGGRSFLQLMEGKSLPGLVMLDK